MRSFVAKAGPATANVCSGYGAMKGCGCRPGRSAGGAGRGCPASWSLHIPITCGRPVFVSDRTADGRPIKILTVTDEHTREALATPAARRMGADDTVNTLDQIVERRGRAPKMIRCDNGPEFISQTLRDWCRFNDAQTGYIEPGAPWQNPFV